MTPRDWSKSTGDYARKLLHSGWEGAAGGADSFLRGAPLSSFLNESVRTALVPTALGVCVGLLHSYPGNGGKTSRRAIAYGLLGGAVGFSFAVAWLSRSLAASAGSGALHNMGRIRDEHWLEKHPIDYA